VKALPKSIRFSIFFAAILIAGACSGNKQASRAPADDGSASDYLNSTNTPHVLSDQISANETRRRLQESQQLYMTEQTLIQQEHAMLLDNSITAQAQVIAANQALAAQMVKTIQDHQFQRSLDVVNPQFKNFMAQNPEFNSPAGVIAGASALWVGRTINVIRNEYIQASTRIEARAKTAQFNWTSPILNGQLHYNPNQGLEFSVGRTISSINTSSQIHYNFTSQTFQSTFTQPITNQLNFQVGAGQDSITRVPAGTAQFNFHMDFK